MPQYELMYLLGSTVADTDVPAVSAQVLDFIKSFGGENIVEQQLGKKKLAYPIGKTRNGHYVVVNFSMDSKKVNDLDAKIRTQDNRLIRYLLTNQDEHLTRLAKDKVAQASLSKRDQTEEKAPEAAPKPEVKAKPEEKAPQLAEINQEELDKKIEEALSEDITK